MGQDGNEIRGRWSLNAGDSYAMLRSNQYPLRCLSEGVLWSMLRFIRSFRSYMDSDLGVSNFSLLY